MIDTLRLNLIDCDIKRSAPLQIMAGITDNSTGKTYNSNDLFIDNTGRIVTGSKAYINDDKFNLTIQSSKESEITENGKSILKNKRFKRIRSELQDNLFDKNSDNNDVTGIFVQTSLPRLLGDTNFKTLSVEDQKKALKLLEDKLKSYGIRTNIFNSNISRVDTFTNVETDLTFFAYANLFNLMECSRMKSIGWNDESFLWKNGNQQLAVYDKVREMMAKDNDWILNERKKALSNKNVMRFENRLLKKRSVESNLNIVTIDDLYKNYDEVKNFHKEIFRNKIFKYTLDEIDTLTVDDFKTKFQISKKLYGKRWWYQYCYLYGVYSIAKNLNNDAIDEIIEMLEGNSRSVRMKKSRIKKSITDAKFNFAKGGIFYDDKTTTKSNVQLYNELKQKFYSEV